MMFLKKTLQGETFLQFDTGTQDPKRILIFYSLQNFDIFKKSRIWLADGTFKSVPHEFYQLYTIHIDFIGATLPIIYILMKDKAEETYLRAFQLILKNNKFLVEYIIMDYEMAPKNALQLLFKNVTFFGCNFHFSQIIWRKIQAFDLVSQYLNDSIFNEFIRSLLSLSFIPKNDILKIYEQIIYKYNDFNSENIKKFVEYFKKNFIGVYEKYHLLEEPKYQYEFWSNYEKVIHEIPRTINSLEAWHRGLNQKVVVPHSNLTKFLSILQKVEEVNRLKITCLLNGKVDIWKKNIKKDLKLKLFVLNYSQFDSEKYIELISSIYKWKLNKNKH